MSNSTLPDATAWADNPYEPEWAERDFLYSPDGNREYPRHACKETYLLAKPFIRNFRNALDIGCRVGEFTRYLHLDFAHVYAFDPNLWPDFRRNVDLGRVTHFNCAIGDEPGQVNMFGGGHIDREGAKTKSVPVYTIDAFGFQNVDFIKIDVEGFEKKVILGAARTIERCNPLIVIEQNHVVLEGDAQYSAKSFLESIGYEAVATDRRGWDFIMVRP